MRVYALWHVEHGYEYRWRTLLQFGTSWNVIGSVYMKNPGSASPIDPPPPINPQILTELNKFSMSTEWKKFTPDNTMKCIEKLFNESRIAPLQGIIQVFNLFNLKDADFDSALKKLKAGGCNHQYVHTFDEDLTNLVFPVYLGWGDLWKDSYFKNHYSNEIKSIFDEAEDSAKKRNKKWYDPKHFYHPKFLYRHPHSVDGNVETEKKAFLAMV